MYLHTSASSNVYFFSIYTFTQDKKQIVHFAAELGYVQILTEVLLAGHNGRAVMEVHTYVHNIIFRECICYDEYLFYIHLCMCREDRLHFY